MIIKLTRPVKDSRDNEITELNLNLEKLNGFNMMHAEMLAREGDKNFALWGTSHIAQIAAEASGVGYYVIASLCARDFMRVQLAIINFFNDLISTEFQEESSEAPF